VTGPRLIMFDYDGVIVDSLAVFVENFGAACRAHGLDLGSPRDLVGLFDSNVYESMAARGLSAGTIDKILQDYEVRQNACLEDLALFAGMAVVLNRIARHHKVVIITSNLSVPTARILARAGIRGIEAVIGADQEKSKIKKIVRTKSRYPDLPAFYVGDTKGDMLEGRQAGARTVAVAWGWHDVAKLQEGVPDYLVYTPVELAALFVAQGNRE